MYVCTDTHAHTYTHTYTHMYTHTYELSLAPFVFLNSEALVVPIGELIGGGREAGAVLDFV